MAGTAGNRPSDGLLQVAQKPIAGTASAAATCLYSMVHHLHLLLTLLLLTAALPSCTKVNRLMKAKPATPAAGFLDFRATPVNETARSPWHYAAFTAAAPQCQECCGRR